MKFIYKIQIIGLTFVLSAANYSCKKFVEVDAPQTELIKETVFTSDATANAAMADVYMLLQSGRFAGGSAFGVGYCGALLSDEMIHYSTRSFVEFQQFNTNSILANNTILTGHWNGIYAVVYRTNAILDGIASSAGISAGMKLRLEGEAKFIRAFCHFYLVNLWGDVPLILTTDYEVNNSIARAPKTDVYGSIIKDLKDAQNLLPADYSLSGDERVLVNKWAATALLSRVYLYIREWGNAEEQATAIIENTTLYSLDPVLSKVFRTGSKEVIFQIWFSNYPTEYNTFNVHPASGPQFGAMRPEFANSFEPGDQRRSTWILDVPVNGTTYYGMAKYQSFATAPPDKDYSTVLRLSEQYLIRAEARAMQGKIIGDNSAEPDVNVIRARAGLGATTANTQPSMLLAIEDERKHELFGEWGHRWFDLKRTGRATTALGSLKPNWEPDKELLPIPEIQLINDPNVTQNPGY